MAIHTLSHIIIDQLSLDAGYPAAALRERLFVDDDVAGLLVYTASSDSAGSLGGVASMAETEHLGAALSGRTATAVVVLVRPGLHRVDVVPARTH